MRGFTGDNAASRNNFFKTVYKQKVLIFMSAPFFIWLIIFAYVPLWGWTMALQDYKPHLSFFNQKWVGFKHFEALFNDRQFWRSVRNTLGMSVMGLTASYTIPIAFALLLNEVKAIKFKRFTQTISYLPHFVSWVIITSISITMLGTDGSINTMLINWGIFEKPYLFLANPPAFWLILTIITMWKELGWSAIIYIAAIAGIDQNLYEAANVDGAGRWRRMWHITLPGILPTIILLFIMSVGNIINIGFERQRLLGNMLVKEYSEVIDEYALRYGIELYRYSYGTAIGIFKSVISLSLMFIANSLARRYRETSLF